MFGIWTCSGRKNWRKLIIIYFLENEKDEENFVCKSGEFGKYFLLLLKMSKIFHYFKTEYVSRKINKIVGAKNSKLILAKKN